MRVIAGKYKGRALISPKGEVRPTTDRVKETVFDILNARGFVQGSRILDLFCGSGALGIEGLSQGGESVVFVDRYTKNVKLNLEKIKVSESVRVITSDFSSALKSLKGSEFDLILCDPPYKSGYEESITDSIAKYSLLSKKGVLFIEHSTQIDLINTKNYDILVERRIGDTVATFLVPTLI